MKDRMKGTYRLKDGVGSDPRKHIFQQTVGSVMIPRNCEIEQPNKYFPLQYNLFCN